MKELQITMDSKYLFVEDRIFSFEKDRLISESEQTLDFWLNLLKENTIFAAQNGRVELSEINKFVKGVAYKLSENFLRASKIDFIYEFERRFGFPLIYESFDKFNFANKLSETWDFIIGKYRDYKFINEQSDQSAFDNWVKTKGKAFIEGLRDQLFKGWAIGLQTFLSFTGGGQVAVSVVWGAILAYDVYMAINGEPNWLNIIIDLVSFLPGVAGLASKVFKGASAVGRSATTVEAALTGIGSTKLGAKLIPSLGKLGTISSAILGGLKEGVMWIAKKIGLSWLVKSISKLYNFVDGILNKIVDYATKFSEGKKILGAKFGGAENVGQAIAKSAKAGGVASAFSSILNTGKSKTNQQSKPMVMRPTSLSKSDQEVINILNNL